MHSYLRTLLLALLSIVGMAGTASYLANPYYLFDVPVLPGLNEIKPRASQRGAVAKSALIERYRPVVLILGNSRAEIGFDPGHAALGRKGTPVFNAALQGTGPLVALQMLDRAIDAGRVRHVLLALEFLDFRVHPRSASPASHPFPDRAIRLSDRFRTTRDALFSLDSVRDAALTFTAQGRPGSIHLTAQGFNPMREYRDIAAREGYGALFDQRSRENVRNYVSGPKSVRAGSGLDTEVFRALRRMLDLAAEHDIEIVVVTYPYHAHVLELFRETGLQDAYEDWRRGVAGLVDEAARRRGRPDAVRAFDFSGYSTQAKEAVPPLGDRKTPVTWYWEAGHFKKELGDVILQEIYEPANPTVRPMIGRLLSSATVDGLIADDARASATYRIERAAEMAVLQRLVDEAQAIPRRPR